MNRRTALTVGLLALAALLGWGVFRLFELRYARGDIYPPYSTLRADPLGAKAIADVIAGLPGFEVRRNFRPLIRLKPETPVTLVYAGIAFHSRWGDDELREFESLITTGTRAVFAFRREFKTRNDQRLAVGTPSPKKKSAKATPAPGNTPAPKKPFAKDEDELPGVAFRDVAARWAFAFDLAQDEELDVLHGKAERTRQAGDLEVSMPWHSALYFKGLGKQWRVLYRCNGVPVVIERDFGRGSIVLASDSYFLSNEGLREVRASRLIAHLLGPPRTVIFDEEHHGVTEDMNIVGLARKHGLEAAVFAILFVIALFVWKNAVPFLPPRFDRSTHEADVTGADATEGFVNLLRRSIPANRILSVCVEEWRKARGRRVRPEEATHVDSVLRAHAARGFSGKDAAAAYRTIAEGLNRR